MCKQHLSALFWRFVVIANTQSSSNQGAAMCALVSGEAEKALEWRRKAMDVMLWCYGEDSPVLQQML